MNLRRILQLALTSFFAQGVSVITQFLVPPFFLRYYPDGLRVYGEWIALSASISYLGTLNYGIQTYANNQTAILFSGGKEDEARDVQASALRLLLLLVGLFVLGGVGVLFIPVGAWLKLTHVSVAAASLTLYLLIVTMALGMLFSLLTNSYLIIGKLHRGNFWSDGQRLFNVVCLSVALYLHSSFPVLALVQLCTLAIFILMVLIDMRKTASILLPSLRHGTWRQTLGILKPSAHFGLIALGGFLTWQGPVLLIQRILGPGAVAIFALVRVVFQMSRQILSVASTMVSQDITLLFGKEDWKTLRRLYDLSERVVMLLIPVVSIGSLLLCPFLFTVWLHKRSIYEPVLCLLMAILSAVLGIKEHKTQFQSSSNQHEEFSIFMLIGYSVMLFVGIFTTKYFGLTGFMITWIAWEIIQTAFVLKLNSKLFPPEMAVSHQPIVRLVLFLMVAFGLAIWPAKHEVAWSLPAVVGFTAASSALLGVAAYYVFGLEAIRSILIDRLRRRSASVNV
jgi:O-antigen/teichoic acid export membrane protein